MKTKSKTKTLYHVTPISNLNSIMKVGLIPKIGERSEGIESEPGIFLFPTYEDCETALGQWLGREFDEIEPYEELVTLKIELPINFPLEETCEWERISRKKIEPKYISFYKNEG